MTGDAAGGLEVRLATGADWDALLRLRQRVFVQEQGVPVELEHDDLDALCDHAVAVRAGAVVGTGRLVPGRVSHDGALLVDPQDRTRTVGRMAVAPEERGTGVGRLVLTALEQRAAALGVRRVELHAQVEARGFYERCGYATVGEPFVEAGILHVTMARDLGSLAGA